MVELAGTRDGTPRGTIFRSEASHVRGHGEMYAAVEVGAGANIEVEAPAPALTPPIVVEGEGVVFLRAKGDRGKAWGLRFVD